MVGLVDLRGLFFPAPAAFVEDDDDVDEHECSYHDE